MANSYLSLPVFDTSADIDAAVGIDKLVGRPTASTFITGIVIRLNSSVGAGNTLDIRYGTDLDGTGGVDFSEVAMVAQSLVREQELADPIRVNANQAVLMRIESHDGSAAVLNGSIRMDSTGLAGSIGGLYTTAERVRIDMGIDTFTNEQSVAVEEKILGVSALFDTITNARFVQRELIERHNGGLPVEQSGIPLHREPSDVQADRDAITLFENDLELTQGTEWFINEAVAGQASGRVVYRLNGTAEGFGVRFARGRKNIKVTYKTRGATTPPDVAMACTSEVHRLVLQANILGSSQDQHRLGISSRALVEGTSFGYTPEGLLPTTLSMLDAYNRNPDRW